MDTSLYLPNFWTDHQAVFFYHDPDFYSIGDASERWLLNENPADFFKVVFSWKFCTILWGYEIIVKITLSKRYDMVWNYILDSVLSFDWITLDFTYIVIVICSCILYICLLYNVYCIYVYVNEKRWSRTEVKASTYMYRFFYPPIPRWDWDVKLRELAQLIWGSDLQSCPHCNACAVWWNWAKKIMVTWWYFYV